MILCEADDQEAPSAVCVVMPGSAPWLHTQRGKVQEDGDERGTRELTAVQGRSEVAWRGLHEQALGMTAELLCVTRRIGQSDGASPSR